MKLSIALSLGFLAALVTPVAHAETKPVARPTPPRTTRPPTALHQQPHSKSPSPPPLAHLPQLPQLPPPDAKPSTPTAVTPPPSTTVAPAIVTPSAPTPKVATPAKPPCLKQPVAFTRGIEEDRFSLAKCDGSVAPEAIEHLSILARPGEAAKPSQPMSVLSQVHGDMMAPGIRRLDGRLAERLQLVVDKFQKSGQVQKLHVISGYRPTSAGSFHQTARALDFRMDGVTNEELVAFCKTLPDTGCGYYPNSSFVHMDVREPGTGHVAWIDASGPGESPRYVPTWPPPKVDPKADAPTLLEALFGAPPPAGTDETPADPKPVAAVVPPPPTAPLLNSP